MSFCLLGRRLLVFGMGQFPPFRRRLKKGGSGEEEGREEEAERGSTIKSIKTLFTDFSFTDIGKYTQSRGSNALAFRA